MKIKCNQFVKRQTEESPFSYLRSSGGGTADWTVLEQMIGQLMSAPDEYGAPISPGYKDGVLVVGVPLAAFGNLRFYSGVVVVTPETELHARFAARRAGEDPYVEVLACGRKTEAVAVDVILYSRALLVAEGEKPDADTDYEIVSINARTSTEPEPMTPMAMARNQLGLPGGTKAEYTADEIARSIAYWSTRSMFGGASTGGM